MNSQTAGADVHVPFGGLKGSAWGPHEQGRAAMEFYTETVTVYQDAPLAETRLVTGASGASAHGRRGLRARQGDEAVGYDLGEATDRLELVLGADAGRVGTVAGGHHRLAALDRALDEHAITRVIHLAALQVPFAAPIPRSACTSTWPARSTSRSRSRRLDGSPGVVYATRRRSTAASDPSTAP